MNRASSATGWVRNPDGTMGWTWNPMSGCLNHVNGMCKGGDFPCYAYKLANGRLKSKYLANQNVAYCYEKGEEFIGPPELVGKCDYSDPFYPRFWPEKLLELRTRKPRYQAMTKAKGIFVCDMSDLFGIGIPEEWTQQVLETIKACPQHRFYLLTKQPQNLIKWEFPDNCWVGVSATNQIMWNESLRYLTDIKASVKYLSIEPYLGRIVPEYTLMLKSGIKWLIIGSLTLTLEDYSNSNYAMRRGLKLKQWGKKWTVQPDIEWVREIVEAADKAKIPVFLKDNLRPLLNGNEDMAVKIPLINDKYSWRQELPDVS
ncbi:MAG: DUF5131 family protein [Thiotrichaceae bacterium]